MSPENQVIFQLLKEMIFFAESITFPIYFLLTILSLPVIIKSFYSFEDRIFNH
jgi:hypothetical protein